MKSGQEIYNEWRATNAPAPAAKGFLGKTSAVFVEIGYGVGLADGGKQLVSTDRDAELAGKIEKLFHASAAGYQGDGLANIEADTLICQELKRLGYVKTAQAYALGKMVQP